MEIIIGLAGIVLLDAILIIGPTILLAMAGFRRLSPLAALAILIGLFVDQSVNFSVISYPKTGIGSILALPNSLFLLSLLFGVAALIAGLMAAFPANNGGASPDCQTGEQQDLDC